MLRLSSFNTLLKFNYKYIRGNFTNPRFLSSFDVHSPLPDVEIPTSTLTDYITRDFKKFGDRPALIDGFSGKKFSFNLLLQRSIAFSHALQKQLKIKNGDCVGIFSPNDVDYFPALHGTISLGAIATTINPTYTPHELLAQLQDSKTRAIICNICVVDKAKEVGKTLNIPVIVMNHNNKACSETLDFDTLIDSNIHEKEFATPSRPINPLEDIAILPYSSGTTGNPKGVCLTHTNLVANLAQMYPTEGKFIEESTIFVCPLPFFHIYGMIVAMSLAALRGSTLISMPKFDLVKFLEICQNYKVTRAHLVPPIILALSKEPIVSKFDLSSLKVILSAAAPLSGAVEKACSDRLGCIVKQAWGMTELSPAGSLLSDDDADPGKACVGPLLPNSVGRIIDTLTEEPLPIGSEGELLIKGPHVMKGYFNNEEANRKTFTSDGFLRTGDIAKFDENGNIFITDRSKELIKYKGFQVPPAELEGILLTHNAVKDAVVIPRNDEAAGELPRAYVVLKPNHTCTAEEIINFVAEQVAPHKKLRGGVVFVDSIPKSPSGKLLRRFVKQQDIKNFP